MGCFGIFRESSISRKQKEFIDTVFDKVAKFEIIP
jgi:hypothetical protein